MVVKWQEDQIECALKDVIGQDPSPQTLWAISIFAKHCRKYCRTNAAFNNFMNRIFSHARFKQVQKIGKDGVGYPGLEITIK